MYDVWYWRIGLSLNKLFSVEYRLLDFTLNKLMIYIKPRSSIFSIESTLL